MKEFGVYDIESSKWKNHLATGYYDIFTEDYRVFYSVLDFIEFIFSPECEQDTFYGHFAGIFDSLFIIDSALRYDYVVDNMIINGRRILSLKIKLGKKSRTFLDSSGLFPFSLRKLTEAFDVEHKKLDENVELFEEVTPELLEYLEYDCRGLAESLLKYSQTEYVEHIGLSLTRSGQSFKIYTKFFNDDLGSVPMNVQSFARKALYGGRTEIIKPSFKTENIDEWKKYWDDDSGSISEPKNMTSLNVFDFNSLYPYVQFKYKFPGDFTHWSMSLDLENFSISDVLIHSPDLYIPFLPCHHAGKLYFPQGQFRGVYTNVELKKAVSLGYKILACYRTAHFRDHDHDDGYPFKTFIKHFYEKRLENKGDALLNIFYKDVMNHLWGRLVMNLNRPSLSFDIESGGRVHSEFQIDDYVVRAYEFSKNIYAKTNTALGLFVPAYGRIELYEAMEKVDFNVHYCDTDSLFTTSKIDGNDNELGALKFEYDFKQWYGLQPKAYAGMTPNKKIVCKTKGIKYEKRDGKPYSPIDAGFWTLDDFENSLEGDIKLAKIKQKNGLAGIKTAMKKGNILHVIPDNEKGVNKRDEKRIWYKNKNGEILTKPHIFKYTEIPEIYGKKVYVGNINTTDPKYIELSKQLSLGF